MTRKILIALCVLFVMPVFAITGCDEVQENLTPESSFIPSHNIRKLARGFDNRKS